MRAWARIQPGISKNTVDLQKFRDGRSQDSPLTNYRTVILSGKSGRIFKTDGIEYQIMKNEDSSAINPVTLKFRDTVIETSFQNDFFAKTISQLRWNVLLGAFLYGVLGVIDYLIMPEIRQKAWVIRYCFVCPVILIIYLSSFTRHFRKLAQQLLIVGGITSSAGAVALNFISPTPVVYLYYTGVLLCLIFYYSFVGMRYTTSTILSWCTFLLYITMISWKADIPAPYLMHNILVLLAFNVTAMRGSYLRERYMRSDFLHRQTSLEKKRELKTALLEVEKARREAEEISRMDPLTNLFNRRHFLSVASLELENIDIFTNCLSVIMIDIDHFKKINDTYGHDAGDLVLLSIAEIIRNTVRRSDIPCRYGGEEFVIVLPGTDLASAIAIGKRLRENIESTAVKTDKGFIPVTASVGISSMSEDSLGEIDVWIKRADEALYEAKQAGRNQVRVWNPEYMITHVLDGA
jgi:diguanylate cyclase (GGDEF)-like protein